MLQDRKKIYRAVAVLLQYPDRTLLRMVPDLVSYIGRMPAGKAKQAIAEFLGYLNSESLLRLQENYTAAFDMNPSTTLNMTFHLLGDGETRAAVMVLLQQSYHTAGFDGPADDLPDFFPAMLEFLAICPPGTSVDLFWQCFASLEGLVRRLQSSAPAYANLLELLNDDYRHWLHAVAPESCPGFLRFIESNGNQAHSRSIGDGGKGHEFCQ